MIELANNVYTVQCDHCHFQQTVQASAYRLEHLKTMLQSFGWALDTDRGDLCRKCATAWKSGRLDSPK